MRRLGVYLCYASVGSCLLTGVSGAQSAATATIVGKVVDPQGAIILVAFIDDLNIVAVRIKHPGRIIARIVFETSLR
jgi:hypothetical protein